MQWSWPAEHVGWKVLWGRYKYILLIVLAGVFLMLLPDGQQESVRNEMSAQQQEEFDLDAMEQKLERALAQIQGAGEVTVVLTLKESTRRILAQDTQQSEQETSSTTVVLSRGSGMEEAVLLRLVYPSYQGVLVVCSGADDARVRLQITQALRALTGLSAEKISVCKGQ